MHWRLIFSGTQSWTWTVVVTAAILLAIVLVVLLRRYEAGLVSPIVGRTLLTLRLLVLLLLLFTLLQPVLTRAWDEERRGRLVVGFDVSESMETADRHARPSEMLRWAQALGMLGNESTQELLSEWVAAYEAGRQPDWGSGDDELGAARRRQIQGVFSELSGMSRTEFVRRLLLSQPNDLLKRLGDNFETDLQVFALDRVSVAGEQLQQVLDSDRAEVRPGGTDAISLLAGCIAEEGGNRTYAVVLFTDGRQTTAADTATEADRLRDLGIRVYCIPVGSVHSPRDLSIASVQVPQSVFLNDTAEVAVTVTASGFIGDEVTVRLEKDGMPFDQQTVTVGADSFDVDFEIPTSEVGNLDFSVSADVQPGELREDNNARDFAVSVVDNKARVLLVDGDARWEFRYLNSALERDKRVELSTVLLRQPYLQLLNRTFLDNQVPGPAEIEEQLANTDILIVGDVDPARIPETFWEAVEHAVTDESLTLMIVPGRRYMPHRFSSPALARLLPVSDVRQQQAERFRRSLPEGPPTVFHLHPTQAARDLTLFHLSGPDGPEDKTSLAILPGHPWASTGTPKPIASVWATVTIDGMDLDPDRMATVVHQYYGFGQVVWFGIDSTWRWRRRAGDRWHHRFWGQVVRWAASNKSAAGNDQVRMTMSDVIVDESAGVDIAVRWNPDLVPQLQDAVVEVLVEPIAESRPEWQAAAGSDDARVDSLPETRKLQLERLEGSPERFSARLSGMVPGTYKIRLNVENSPVRLQEVIESELIVQQRFSTELANISCNREFLQQLATMTGGRLVEPAQLSELPDLLRPEDVVESLLQELTLWDHWALLIPFFLLLTVEWMIRKLNGLP